MAFPRRGSSEHLHKVVSSQSREGLSCRDVGVFKSSLNFYLGTNRRVLVRSKHDYFNLLSVEKWEIDSFLTYNVTYR